METSKHSSYIGLKSALTGKRMYVTTKGVIAMYQDEIYGYDANKGETSKDLHPLNALVLVYSGDYRVYVHQDDEQAVMNVLHTTNRQEPWF